MLRKRTRNTILIAVPLLILLAFAIFLRMKAPPEPARLLPESDAILYVDLKPLRTATHLDPKKSLPPADDPAYQHFVDATGFNFERDLDEVAIALHQMPDPKGPNGPVAFSAVFQGRIDRKKMGPYLASLAISRETYEGNEILSIPSDGRTVRVTFLGYDMVATSNMPTPEQIHSIVERYRTAALPSSGSSLLAERYGDVPLLSFAWGIGRLGLPFVIYPPPRYGSNQLQIMGLTLPIPADATFIASVGFDANLATALAHSGSVHLRVDEITTDAATAEATTQTLQNLLNLYRTFQPYTQQPTTREAAALQLALHSLHIQHHSNRVQLSGTASADIIRGLFSPTVHNLTTPNDSTTK